MALSAGAPPSAAAATSFRASLTSSATSYQSLPQNSRHFLRMSVRLDESDSTTRLRPPEPRDCRHQASHTVATETAATAPRATSSRVVGMAAAHDQMRNGAAESETLSRSRPTLGLEAAVAPTEDFRARGAGSCSSTTHEHHTHRSRWRVAFIHNTPTPWRPAQSKVENKPRGARRAELPVSRF